MSDTGHYRSDGAQPSDGRRHGPHARTTSALRPPRRTGLWRHLRRALGADHNPLCRPFDRARSGILLATGALLAAALLGAWAIAQLVVHSELAAAAQQRAHRHLVSAVTVSAPISATGYGTGGAQAQASWTYPRGTAHTAWIPVPDGTANGATVSTWVDDTGQPSNAPRTGTAAAADGALAGVGALVGESGLLLLAGGLAIRVVARRADRAWDDEWQRIEPGWSGWAYGKN